MLIPRESHSGCSLCQAVSVLISGFSGVPTIVSITRDEFKIQISNFTRLRSRNSRSGPRIEKHCSEQLPEVGPTPPSMQQLRHVGCARTPRVTSLLHPVSDWSAPGQAAGRNGCWGHTWKKSRQCHTLAVTPGYGSPV